jgi:flagellum-specific ATP synthase
MLSLYQQNRDLIAIGAYQKGSDPRIDAAIAMWPTMQKFLQQDMHERVDYDSSLAALHQMMGDA